MIWILFAAVTITGLIILSGVEYGKRLAAEHRVATLEAQMAELEATRRAATIVQLTANVTFHDAMVDAASARGAKDLIVWPLPNVWLGVSVENQQWADIRIPALLDTPAAVRFLSCEPLLGPVDLRTSCLDWVIVGGESGRGARPMDLDWVRSLRDQCTSTVGVSFFYKQQGSGDGGHKSRRELDGRAWDEFPGGES